MDIQTEKPYQGRAQWIKLVTNNIRYGPLPHEWDEVEQRLRVSADGRVWLSRYDYGTGYKHICTKKEQFNIGVEQAKRLLEAVDDCFNDNTLQFTTDVGSWDLTVANQDGDEFKLTGSLTADPESPEARLSDLIREILDNPDILAFDGNAVLERVEKLTIEYNRIAKIKPEVPISENFEFFTWNYSERLVIDRAAQTLEHVQNIGTSYNVSQRYYVEGGIESILDSIYNHFFDFIKGDPEDAVVDPLEQRDFRLIVDCKKAPQRVITGSYAKDALPHRWADLMEHILSFMLFYGMGEILNPSIYSKKRRRSGDRIFLSVAFDDYGKTYCYLTDDDSITVGDYVLVPVGTQGRTVRVEVKGIDYLPEDKAPIPFEKIKPIIRKCIK